MNLQLIIKLLFDEVIFIDGFNDFSFFKSNSKCHLTYELSRNTTIFGLCIGYQVNLVRVLEQIINFLKALSLFTTKSTPEKSTHFEEEETYNKCSHIGIIKASIKFYLIFSLVRIVCPQTYQTTERIWKQ